MSDELLERPSHAECPQGGKNKVNDEPWGGVIWEQIVGAAIRAQRNRNAISRRSLALAADVDERYLGAIERGEGNPSVQVLGRIARALRVHPSIFFSEDQAPPAIG